MRSDTRGPELSLLLLRHGYGWSRRLRARGTGAEQDVRPARMLGRPALVVRGPEGVRMFCDTALVQRKDAMPAAVAGVLFGRGAVHGLDDEQHQHRKGLFVQATRAPEVAALVEAVGHCWARRLGQWRTGEELLVEDAAVEVIGEAVMSWAGVPGEPAETAAISHRLADIVDGFGVVGPANVKARLARRRSDAWARKVVRDARQAAPAPPPGSVLELVAGWTDEHGRLLPEPVAAVELQNVLRPTVAVSRFVAFGVRYLAANPVWRERLEAEHREATTTRPGPMAYAVAHEVRRLTPFVPALAAVARKPLEVGGHTLPAGGRLVLDVIGTLHDSRYWVDAERFDPVRFLGGQDLVADALVPQGGGEVARGHRCPGEDTTLGILATSLTALAAASWRLPAQDLAVSTRRMPTRPASGVRLVATAPDA